MKIANRSRNWSDKLDGIGVDDVDVDDAVTVTDIFRTKEAATQGGCIVARRKCV